MGRLVALAIPPGPGWIEAIERIWADGDAVAPLDDRLPPGELDRVIEALRPGAVLDADGTITTRPDGEPTDDGDALVIATSGTSGRPKAVVHTHDTIAASARATSTALGVDPERDRWLACLPLAHIGGLAVVLRSMVTGTAVEVHPQFDPAATVDALDRGATLVSLVTRALNQVPAERFRTVLVGGAAPPATLDRNVVATYGMTETGSGVVYEGPGLGRTGPVLVDGLELRIGGTVITAATGAAGGRGGTETSPVDGEIHLRGPMLLRRYRNDPDPFTADGWFPTGDLGRLINGRLVVEGRRGDVIVTGGEKVWPEPVERLLAARPDVADVAVIGRPDPEWGHRVTAVVVPETGLAAPSVEQLRDTVVAELPVWAAPKAVEEIADIPRTSLGKIRRSEL
ncbi:MAG: fatty acid--CoA ligase family protein [Actinomycetota bacterium]